MPTWRRFREPVHLNWRRWHRTAFYTFSATCKQVVSPLYIRPSFSFCRSDEPSLARAISQAEQHFGHIDGLILNAAVLEPLCRIGDSTALSAWKTHFDVNFFSLITAIRSALPALRRSDIGGRIVFVSSGSAVKGTAGWGPYNASKAAMNSLCRYIFRLRYDR